MRLLSDAARPIAGRRAVAAGRLALAAAAAAALLGGAMRAAASPAGPDHAAASAAAEPQAGGSGAQPVRDASARDGDRLADVIAGAERIAPAGDGAAMDRAFERYAAQLRATRTAKIAEAANATASARFAPDSADPAPWRSEASRDALGPAKRERSRADEGTAPALAPATEPTAVDGWRSFDMAGTGYLGSNGALAVGPGGVLGVVNGGFGAWSKAGAPLMAPTDLTSWFEPLTSQVEDDLGIGLHVVGPRAAYARAFGRYVLAAIALPVEDDVDVPVIFAAMSRTADPSGPFCVVRITPLIGDDPLGIGINDLSLSVNDHAMVLAIGLYERLADGSAVNYATRAFVEHLAPLADCSTRDSLVYPVYDGTDLGTFNSLTVADTLGSGDEAVFVGSHDSGGAALQPMVIGWDAGGSPSNLAAVTPIGVPSYTYPPDATQPGSGSDVATGYASVRGAVYLGPDDLWTVQSVTVGTGAGAAWQRLSLDAGALDGGRVGLGEGADLYHPQIMPALECDTAFLAFNYSSAAAPVSAAVMQLGEDAIVPIADGDGCVAPESGDVMPWDPRVPIAYDPSDGRYWLQPSVADGSSSDCTANQWATHLVHLTWDLCELGPEPTPPPTGDRKGIGFALGSKRFMRDVQGPSGMVPRRGAMTGPALTGIQVQNIDGVRVAEPDIEFAQQRSPYGPAGGGQFVRTIEMDTIPPGASLNAYLPGLDLIDAMYRVTITTPRDGGDLSAILRTDWDTGGAAIVSNLWHTTRLIIPRVARNALTHTSVIAVTNADRAPTTVTMRFYASGSSAVVSTKQFDMAPAEALTFDLADADPAFSALGSGFVGTAILETAGGFVGAQVYEYIESSELAIGGYEGIPAGQASSRLFVPLFRHQQHGPGGIRLDTAIVVANAGAEPADVTVSYRPTTNPSASDACRAARLVRHGPVRVQPNSSYAFYQGPGGGHGLPDNCFGSAVVDGGTAGDRLVATVMDVQNRNEQLSMINASPVESAANKHALPLFRSRHLVAEYTTGIQVMNTSALPANVHIDFSRSEGNVTFPITGCRGQCDAVIQPYEAYTWWPPAVEVIPVDTYGAAVIESDQPIVVLVNDYPLRGRSDMATYAGIAVMGEP